MTTRFAYIIASLGWLCACLGPTSNGPEPDLGSGGKQDGSAGDWVLSGTLHVGALEERWLGHDGISAERHVYSMFVGASTAAPVELEARARTLDGTPLQLALLAPADATGISAVIAFDGYGDASSEPLLRTAVELTGVYRIVISSRGRSSAAHYQITSACTANCELADAVHAPKAGALVSDRTFAVDLNDALADRDVELWAAPPNRPAQRRLIATQRTRDGIAIFALPNDVADGDDLSLTSREVESGMTMRLWTSPEPRARVDSVAIGDLGNVVELSGVAAFYEGSARLTLHAVTRQQLTLASAIVPVTMPGQHGFGLAMFDATFTMELGAAHEGETLSVGYWTEQPSYVELGRFEYCNDPSGMAGCHP